MEKKQKNDKIKIIIIILAVLLGISSVSLAGMLIYKQISPSLSASVLVPDNIIGSENSKKVTSGYNDENNYAIEVQPPEVDDKDKSDTTDKNLSSTEASTTTSAEANATSETANTTSSETANKTMTDITNAATNMTANVAVGTNRIATKLSLHSKSTEYNVPFNAINMFPGDTETKYFCVQVSYREGITVKFTADVRSGYEKLAEVLKCKVVLLGAGKTLYDGLMKDMPESLEHYLYSAEETTSELYYEITAYLDTSVGNEYQNKALAADFHWWVDAEDEEYLIEAPKTGDETNILLWVSLWGTSLCMLLLLWMKKKKEVQHDAR